ncbi:hypothetical protein EDB86DRAFT_3083335 [Lactarius hatsudake]|nr:hypothetical protein EDB86DRAFT_3083335 [Lactarius hatsudake]
MPPSTLRANDANSNDNRTPILLTFDETETYTANNNNNNRILPLLLGGAVPESARGTFDSTYYTHYFSLFLTLYRGVSGRSAPATRTNSGLSNPPANLCPAGRSRTSTPLSPTRWITRTSTSPWTIADIPLTNITVTILGPLNVQDYVTRQSHHARKDGVVARPPRCRIPV